MEFNRKSFLFMTLMAHLMLVGMIVRGTALMWAVCIGLFVFGALISTVFYHRLLSHRSWRAPKWAERIGVFLGIFTLTGTPLTRTAVHRMHHLYADTENDPHSPRFLSALDVYLPQLREHKLDLRLVKDVLRDSYLMGLHKHYVMILFATSLVIPFEWAIVWGGAAALIWMNIFLCNMFCHTKGAIRDNWLFGLLTFGEGHHRWHHENQKDPRFGAFDPGYWLIRLLRR